MSLNDLNVFSKNEFDFESFDELLKVLDRVSYKSNLGKNLKNTLRKFDKQELISDLEDCITFYYVNARFENHNFRIKSLSSILLKYNRYYPSKEVRSCFNDLLGMRVFIDDLDKLLLDLNTKEYSNIRVVDLSRGKKVDDGYRSVHLYYQKSNYHYPIEIQFWNKRDRDFHNWLHKYSYKYTDGTEGVLLRNLFEDVLIMNENEFLCSLKLIKGE